jgi:long-chain acyl-CoA synthetase
MLISDSTYLEPVRDVLATFKSMKILDINGDSPRRYVSFQHILASNPAAKPDISVHPDDVAVIAYTSGPAFRPHGVMLTHRSLIAEAEISAAGFRQTEKDISILFALPLHHVFGLVGILLTSIYAGSTVIIVPGLSLSGMVETIAKEKVTIFMGVPYLYSLLINIAKSDGIGKNIGSVRLWGSSGAPLSETTIKDFRECFGVDLINFWGLSEASCHVTCPALSGDEGRGSVGNALPGWEIKINADGEILVRGTPVMQGYYRNRRDSDAVLKDGWLHTGDVGRLDAEGYLYITGRKKRMIIRKGQNIYPVDVEVLLKKHTAVARAEVTGTVDLLRGEELSARVTLKPNVAATEQELKQFCLEHIASYKVPKQIAILNGVSPE